MSGHWLLTGIAVIAVVYTILNMIFADRCWKCRKKVEWITVRSDGETFTRKCTICGNLETIDRDFEV